MNPSTAAARAVVDALVQQGVTEVVVCPGSRSAPLAYALHAAGVTGVLRIHVRHDERAAGFTALGLSLGAGPAEGPAAVVTTSGTAVANLHPAVLEAHEAGVPLVVLTADRPHGLRGTWANQTTALQAGVFGRATRTAVDLPASSGGDLAAWRAVVVEAVGAARGAGGATRPGPVHLDLAFDDPLAPDDDEAPVSPPRRRVEAAAGPAGSHRLPAGPRTVVVAGAGAGDDARRLAESGGWPLLAEPSSGARCGPNAVGPYRLLLDLPAVGGRVERAVVLGRPTLSRPVTRLLARPDVEVLHVVRHPDEPGPVHPASRIVGTVVVVDGPSDEGWLALWRAAGAVAADAVDEVLGAGGLTGPLVAREVARATGAADLLVAAASNPVRDLDLAGGVWDSPRRVLANRGLSGIDGTLSTAAGAALAAGAPTRVLVGDVAFLHDLNGLLLGPGEPEPHLQVVVLNDDGGGIFGLLEHGEPRHAAAFERVFGTPHGADLEALCRGLGVRHRLVQDLAGLRSAVAAVPPGRSVVEVRASRPDLRPLHASISAAVGLAVAQVPT